MAGFEDLIRTTLAKQGDPTLEKRQAIYNSARQALERMIREGGKLDAVSIEKQRARLSEAIRKVEAGFDDEPSTIPPLPLKSGPFAKTAVDPDNPPVEAPPSTPVTTEDKTPPVAASTSVSSAQGQAEKSETPVAVSPPISASPPAPQKDALKSPPAEEVKVDDQIAVRHVAAKETAVATPPETKTETKPQDKTASKSGSEISMLGEKKPADTQNKRSGKRTEPGLVSPDLIGTPESSLEDDAKKEPVAETYTGPALRERRPYAKLLLWAIILAGIGVSIWWAVNFGPAFINDQLDGSVPNPQQTIESGGFIPPGEDGWITVFSPDSNPEALVTGNSGAAELVEVEGKQVARLASNSGGSNNNILIRIPPGVRQGIRAKAATFEVILKAVAGDGHQFAFYCQFSKLGTCGRKRFTASKTPEPYIFDVLINDARLDEGDDAYLAINTDLSGEGRALDVTSIRVRADK